jgi:hypothetical protein
LIERQHEGQLTEEERQELADYLQLEHLMIIAKAQAQPACRYRPTQERYAGADCTRMVTGSEALDCSYSRDDETAATGGERRSGINRTHARRSARDRHGCRENHH